jgi:hypothetical protein
VRHEVDTRAGLGYLQGFSVAPVALGHHAPLVGAAALARSLPAQTGRPMPSSTSPLVAIEGPAVKVAERAPAIDPRQPSVRATAR